MRDVELVEANPYGDEFYLQYEAYLKEDSVRKAHDWVFSLLSDDFEQVVDLGCGKSMEFYFNAFSRRYIGIDKNVDPNLHHSWRGNYRDIDALNAAVDRGVGEQYYLPRAFVSLFSTEITAPAEENYSFYNLLFTTFPTFRSGLVSGFYYSKRKYQSLVSEPGGVYSFQTLESMEQVKSKIFSEKRIILPVPSKMFGDDVYEVWKIFERRL